MPVAAGFVDRLLGQLRAALGRAEGLFDWREQAFVEEQLRRLGELPLPAQVPCHGDFCPRNWLVGEEGVVRVIDFAGSRWQVTAYDFTRLHFGPWMGRSHLAEAFFEGYGRPMSVTEREFVRPYGASYAVRIAAWAHQRNRPAMVRRARRWLGELMADPSGSDRIGATHVTAIGPVAPRA